MKRRPPPGNVRTVGSNGSNNRGLFVNRFGALVQSESGLERAWILMIDRDPTVTAYVSQPEQIEYWDEDHRIHTHVPDFRVQRIEGVPEIHEVTTSERLEKSKSLQIRSEAMRRHCEKRGERYIINTEKTLPQGRFLANLEFLLSFRPSVYYEPPVVDEILDLLHGHRVLELGAIIVRLNEMMFSAGAPVHGVVLHLLWHQTILADLQTHFIVSDGEINRNLHIWLPEDAGGGAHG